MKADLGLATGAALLGLSCFTLLALPVHAQPVPDPAPERIGGAAPQAQGISSARFAVALQLAGSWCYGYLSVTGETVRFEVVQPREDSRYSFEAPRMQVAIRQWVLLGMPQDAIEVQAKGATFHMRWLADSGEVITGSSRRWTPPLSRPPYALIAAIQNPATALPSSRQPAAMAATAATATAATGDNDSPAPPAGMLAGVYVATAGADARPSNRQFIFYPDGTVMNGLPQEGMIGFDFSHYRPQDNPTSNWVGRYRVAGDEIQISWMNRFADPTKLDRIKRDETSAHPMFQPGWQVFIPMCRCTGKRLSGTYRWGAPAQDQYLQFFPDGTFIDHRVTDQLIVPSRFYEHPRIQRGRYEIARQTILFSFADGHRGMRTFLAPKAQTNNATFDWIDLGWQMLFEEGYRASLSR